MRIPSNKISDVIRFFRSELQDIHEAGELEQFIWFCFQEYLGFTDRSELISRAGEYMSESELLKFNFAIKDLKKHRPIQYILGKTEFFGLPFLVNEHVLIPRPETEELVDLIVRDNKTKKSLRILDVGTGSGCIPVTLKNKLPFAEVHALDISASALELAGRNADLNKTLVHFHTYDILKAGQGWSGEKFDVIVSNPPYITTEEKSGMHPNVIVFEPHLALFVNGPDPLLFYRNILAFSGDYLVPGGRIYFEINPAFGKELKDLLLKEGYQGIELFTDLNGHERMLTGTRVAPI